MHYNHEWGQLRNYTNGDVRADNDKCVHMFLTEGHTLILNQEMHDWVD